MARTDPQINLRIPADLKDALDAEAAKNKRSLTAEVVARLEASLNDTSTWAKTFPLSAASAVGNSKALELARELQAAKDEIARASQLRMDLQTQQLNLDTQAIQVQRELQMVRAEIEQADSRKDSAAVSALLKRDQALQMHLRAIDGQAGAVKQALKKLQVQSRLRETAEQDARPGEPRR